MRYVCKNPPWGGTKPLSAHRLIEVGNNRKKGDPVSVLGRARQNPYEMSTAWEPDRRSNFFSPPANLCAVTCMTEISLNLTLSNQYSLTPMLYSYHCSRYIQFERKYNIIIV